MGEWRRQILEELWEGGGEREGKKRRRRKDQQTSKQASKQAKQASSDKHEEDVGAVKVRSKLPAASQPPTNYLGYLPWVVNH